MRNLRFPATYAAFHSDVFPGLLAESEPQPKRHCPDGEALSSKAAEEVTPQVSRWRVHCYAFCRDPRPEQELKVGPTVGRGF